MEAPVMAASGVVHRKSYVGGLKKYAKPIFFVEILKNMFTIFDF